MSQQFYAVHRKTGERWKPENGKKQYLMLYDSGYLAVITEDFYTYISPLDPKEWKLVMKRRFILSSQQQEEELSYE